MSRPRKMVHHRPLQPDLSRCDLVHKRPVVLDKQHRGFGREQQVANLHPREHIHKVQRFIPNVEMRPLGSLAAIRRSPFFSTTKSRASNRSHGFCKIAHNGLLSFVMARIQGVDDDVHIGLN